MSYIFKQKLRIEDLVNYDRNRKRVLIYEPEEYLGALYGSYLRAHDFEVSHCQDLQLLHVSATGFLPKLLIFNLENDEKKKGVWLENFSRSFPHVIIVTVGFNTDSEFLKQLMPFGLAGHINRRLSKPKDIVDVVKTLLSNN